MPFKRLSPYFCSTSRIKTRRLSAGGGGAKHHPHQPATFYLVSPTCPSQLVSMGTLENQCDTLRAQIAATEVQLASLKRDLFNAEKAAAAISENAIAAENSSEAKDTSARRWPLEQEEYKRYGRQMIVSQIGLPGKSHIFIFANYIPLRWVFEWTFPCTLLSMFKYL